MNNAQRYALAHPLNRTDIDQDHIQRLTCDQILPGGNILRVILAIDRSARLNDGAPVWHTSVSITTPDQRKRVKSAGLAQRYAVAALTGVGGDREWWIWNPQAGVGHLRVGLNLSEVEALAGGFPAEHDAGPSGPERPRRRR